MGRFGISSTLLVALVLCLFSGCHMPFTPSNEAFPIAGRYTSDVEYCPVVVTDHGNYNVDDWANPAPLGSQVVLLVRKKEGYASYCSGEIVDVVRVVSVTTNFRTSPVTGSETWGPNQGPIVLGRVDVEPGGALTILPGTAVRIIPEGWLRVRGTLSIRGAEGDSISIASSDTSHSWPSGRLILDGATMDSLAYLSVPELHVASGDARIRNSSIASVTAGSGSLVLSQCDVGSLDTAYEGEVIQATDCRIRRLGTVFSTAELENDRLGDILLSYSSAHVRR